MSNQKKIILLWLIYVIAFLSGLLLGNIPAEKPNGWMVTLIIITLVFNAGFILAGGFIAVVNAIEIFVKGWRAGE